MNIPLGLNEKEREEFLKSTPERKFEIKEPVIEKREKINRRTTKKILEDQQSIKPQEPAAPYLPDPTNS